MQAISTSCHLLFSPAKLSSPAAKLHHLTSAQELLPPTKIRRVVSTAITTPASSSSSVHPAATSADDDDQESVAAFWDYQFLFVSQRAESVQPVILRTVDGKLPSDFPSGTYYLTGPGIFSDDHGSTVHPLDGHGYLRAFTIDGSSGEVRFSARYIKTEAQMEECDRETGTWRFTHRGPFSVLRGGKKIGNTKVMKNVANTSVVRWGGRLLCLWEGGDPYEIDIQSGSLDTVGRFDVIDGRDLSPQSSKSSSSCPVTDERDPVPGGGGGGGLWDVAAGLLKPILQGVFKMPPKRLLSHYKIDPKLDRLLTVSCNAEDMLLPRSSFTFYEFDSNFKLIQKQEFNIPEHLMIHDWAYTDTHYVLFGNRIKLDVAGSMLALCGVSPMISALSVNPNKPTSPIYLLPRFPPTININNHNHDRDWKVPIEAPTQMWVLHVGNAFEQTDHQGNLEVQIHAATCSYRWFNFHKMFGYDWKSGKLDPSFMNASDGDEDLLPHLVKVSIKLNIKADHHDVNYEEYCSVEACTLDQWSRPSDFPTINPTFSGSKNAYIYAATTATTTTTTSSSSSGCRPRPRSCCLLPHFPFDTVAKLDFINSSVSTWSVGTRRFIGEPIFVPKAAAAAAAGIIINEEEDDGYILVIEYAVSIQRCYLVILNPKQIGKSDAVIARLEVPKHMNFPLGFHGFWAADR